MTAVSSAAQAAYGLIDDVNAFDLDTAMTKIPYLDYRIPLPVFSQATSRAIDALKNETPESWTMVVTAEPAAGGVAAVVHLREGGGWSLDRDEAGGDVLFLEPGGADGLGAGGDGGAACAPESDVVTGDGGGVGRE